MSGVMASAYESMGTPRLVAAWIRYCTRPEVDASFHEYADGHTILTGTDGAVWELNGFDKLLEHVRKP